MSVCASCNYHSEEDLFGATCDTVNVTYNARVVPILQTKCYACHGDFLQQAGLRLDSYDAVLPVVQNEKLLKSIIHAEGVVPMPYEMEKLSQCEIDVITKWINLGAPND